MQPDPADLELTRGLGYLVLAMAGIGLLSGKAWFRGVIDRRLEPEQFWQAVVSQVLLGAFCVVGSLVA